MCGSTVNDSGSTVQVGVCGIIVQVGVQVGVCGSAVHDSGSAVQECVCGSAVNDSGSAVKRGCVWQYIL